MNRLSQPTTAARPTRSKFEHVAERARLLIARRPQAMLFSLCLVCFLPGLFVLPPLDRDEARYAQASAQMLESGDYLDIRFQEAPRYKKPTGIYWLQAASVSLFSTKEARAIWAYRLPSLLGGIMAVFFTFWGVRRLKDPATGFWAAALLAPCLVLAVEATIAKTDAVLLATIITMQMALGRLYLHSSQNRSPQPFGLSVALVFWLSLSAGILIKGPITPMVAGLTVFALCAADRSLALLRHLHILVGVIIVAALIGPWAYATWVATDGTFFAKALGADLAPKLLSGQESHGAPPGYFTALVMVGFWPGSLFLVPAIGWAWQQRTQPLVRFALAWALPTWIVFEIIPTKLPHYTLPVYPALALLCAAALLDVANTKTTRHLFDHFTSKTIGLGIWVLVTLALGGLLIAGPLFYAGGLFVLPFTATLLVLFFAGIAAWAYWQTQVVRAAIAAIAAAVIFHWGLLQFTLPNLTDLQVSTQLAAAIARHQIPGEVPNEMSGTPLIVTGYGEPSFVFLTQTTTKLVPPKAAARLLIEYPDALVLVEARAKPDFHRAIEQAGLTLDPLEEIAGLNYSRGQSVNITLYRVAQ